MPGCMALSMLQAQHLEAQHLPDLEACRSVSNFDGKFTFDACRRHDKAAFEDCQLLPKVGTIGGDLQS